MMVNHLIYNEPQEFLREIRIEMGVFRQRPQSLDLDLLTAGIGRRHARRRLIFAYRLGDLEALLARGMLQ